MDKVLLSIFPNELTNHHKEIFNRGPNCYLYCKYNSSNKKIKKTEIEMYQRIELLLQEEELITTEPEIRDLLKAEAIKLGHDKRKNSFKLLTKPKKITSKELCKLWI